MLIEFRDEEMLHAIIETDADPADLEDLVEEFKEARKAYDIDDLFEFLKQKDIKFESIPVEGDHTIYF